MRELFDKLTPSRKTIVAVAAAILLLSLTFLLGRSSKPEAPQPSPTPTTTIKEKVKGEESPSLETQNQEPQIPQGPIDHRGIVSLVIDGDTVDLESGERVRYLGINTPETGRPFSTEATEANKKLVEAKEVGLELDVQTKDQYGRTLAYVWVGETMVNLELVRQGFANVYTLPPNIKYKDEFLSAEKEAREAERGLWAKAPASTEAKIEIININADAPGNDNENKNGEWVELKNAGNSTTNMNGWTLKDEANHIYTFQNFSLAPNTSVFIYSGAGTGTETKLYWDNPKTAIWNNSGDTAFLRDASGNLIDSYKY